MVQPARGGLTVRGAGVLMMAAGGVLALAGLALLLAPRLPFLGRLPGDIHCRGKHVEFVFPLATCLLVSLALTLLVNLALRLMRK